jgi:hypothetical protein
VLLRMSVGPFQSEYQRHPGNFFSTPGITLQASHRRPQLPATCAAAFFARNLFSVLLYTLSRCAHHSGDKRKIAAVFFSA